jgi:hypothetical protein
MHVNKTTLPRQRIRCGNFNNFYKHACLVAPCMRVYLLWNAVASCIIVFFAIYIYISIYLHGPAHSAADGNHMQVRLSKKVVIKKGFWR